MSRSIFRAERFEKAVHFIYKEYNRFALIEKNYSEPGQAPCSAAQTPRLNSRLALIIREAFSLTVREGSGRIGAPT